MTRSAAILLQILKLGQCFTDQLHEPFDDWRVRADTIAEAIDVSARTNQEAAFLAYMAWHEAKNSKWINEGNLVKHGRQYYWGLWQVQKLIGDAYARGLPVAITKAMASEAIDLYRHHRLNAYSKKHMSTLIDGIRGYGGYNRWSPIPRVLAARIRKIERKLDAMTSEGIP
jgi:hypothetical protein